MRTLILIPKTFYDYSKLLDAWGAVTTRHGPTRDPDAQSPFLTDTHTHHRPEPFPWRPGARGIHTRRHAPTQTATHGPIAPGIIVRRRHANRARHNSSGSNVALATTTGRVILSSPASPLARPFVGPPLPKHGPLDSYRISYHSFPSRSQSFPTQISPPFLMFLKQTISRTYITTPCTIHVP